MGKLWLMRYNVYSVEILAMFIAANDIKAIDYLVSNQAISPRDCIIHIAANLKSELLAIIKQSNILLTYCKENLHELKNIDPEEIEEWNCKEEWNMLHLMCKK